MLLLFLFRVSTASAATDSISRSIVDGTTEDEQTTAVALVTAGMPFCSGVLVAPRVVATAAHCTVELDHTVVFFGGDPKKPGDQRAILHRQVHPNYLPATFTNDIALLHLEEEAPPGTPIWSHLQTASTPLEVGDTLQVFGYGSTTHNEDPWRRRAGTVVVEELRPWVIRAKPGPSLTCVGDSGGPAVSIIEGTPLLVGITSKGDPECSKISQFVRIEPYWEEFISPYLEVVAREPSGGCSVGQGRFSTSARNFHCVPLFSVLVGLLLLWRRRRAPSANSIPG